MEYDPIFYVRIFKNRENGQWTTIWWDHKKKVHQITEHTGYSWLEVVEKVCY